MPYPAPGLSYPGLSCDVDAPSEAAERTWPVQTVRIVLAGAFTAGGGSTRPAIEAAFAEQSGGPLYHVTPTRETQPVLAANGADLVLLDLTGPVNAVLALIGRLRAAAAESVVFVGIMPCDASEAARLYLPAVLDAVVHGPLRAAGLAWAITDALRSTSILPPILAEDPRLPPLVSPATRH